MNHAVVTSTTPAACRMLAAALHGCGFASASSRVLRRCLGLGMAWAVLGCASPGQPTTQTIRVETPGCARAICELSNDLGIWRLSEVPGEVTLTPSREPLKVSCRANDGMVGRSDVLSALPNPTGAGAVAGGAVGGAAVGAAFGAAALAFIPPLGVVVVLSGVAAGAAAGQAVEEQQREARYPTLISIPMYCPPSDPTAVPSVPRAAVLGLSVRGFLPDEARAVGLGGRSAVLVTAVIEGGRAAAAGIRSGDIVLAVDGQPVNDATALEERMRAIPASSPARLRLWRQGGEIELVLLRSEITP